MKRVFGWLMVPVIAFAMSFTAPSAFSQEKKEGEKKEEKSKKKKKGEKDKKEEKK